MALLVEMHSLFMAADAREAEELLDRVMDAELAIICPSDPARLSECTHCEGSLINPPEDASSAEREPEDSDWAPGKPCAICANSDHPGREMSCAREHTAGATIHPDGKWTTSETRRTTRMLERLLATLNNEGPAATRAVLKSMIADIKTDEEEPAHNGTN